VKPWIVFAFIFVSALSHGLIDALTDGGHGIAFFWPFSAERYFFDAQPIPVSPIGPAFFSPYGLFVFLSEIGMIWLPCLLLGGAGLLARKFAEKKKS
jgi:inner membrane protein